MGFVFARRSKDRDFAAQRLRQAYRKRVFEVLGPADEDPETIEDSLAQTPVRVVDLELTCNAAAVETAF